MPNVRISDLPLATLPLDLTGTFFEVQTVESGVDVSRKVAGDNLTFSAGVIQGTSIDDPSIAAGVFNGAQVFQNANGLQTGSVGFGTPGDDFIIRNFAEAGDIQFQLRDGTVLAQTLPAASGGLQVNNTLTGGGLERVLTLSDLGGGVVVNVGTVEGQALRWDDAAGEWDPTSTLLFNVGDITSSLNFIIDRGDAQLILRSAGGDLLLFNDDPFAGSQNLSLSFAGDDILRANNAVTPQTMLFSIGEATPGLTITPGQAACEAGTAGDFILSGNTGNTTSVSSLELQTLGSAFSIDYDGTAQTITMRERNSNGGAVGNTYLEINRTTSQLSLFRGNTSIARTVVAASGGLEVNNTSTGAGFERVLTTADLGVAGVTTFEGRNGAVVADVADYADVLTVFSVLQTFGAHAAFLDADEARFGTGNDVQLVFNATDMLFNAVDGVDFRFVGGTGGAENMLVLTSNGSVDLYNDGVLAAQTAALASGGFLVNQDLNAGFVAVATRAVGGDIQGAVLQVTVSRTNNTLADDAVLAGFELDPSQAYILDCILLCNGNGATNNDFQWAFDFNGEIANVTTFDGHVIWYEEGLTTAVIDSTDHATGGLSGNVDFTSTADYIVVISVGIVTGAGYAAGTAVDLQWAQLVTQVTATRLVEGSYMKLTRMTSFG